MYIQFGRFVREIGLLLFVRPPGVYVLFEIGLVAFYSVVVSSPRLMPRERFVSRASATCQRGEQRHGGVCPADGYTRPGSTAFLS